MTLSLRSRSHAFARDLEYVQVLRIRRCCAEMIQCTDEVTTDRAIAGRYRDRGGGLRDALAPEIRTP